MRLSTMRLAARLLLGAALLALPRGAEAQTGFSVPAVTVNSSVVIATGNTFQVVLSAAARRSLTVQNNNAADSCWLFIGAGSATKGTSLLLLAGGAYTRYFPYIPSDAIQATCANTSDTLYVDTQ